MAKQLNQGFKNVLTYSAGMEEWVNKNLYGEPMKYTFVRNFAVADWMSGTRGIMETYQNVKNEWLCNYKAFTEVVIALNMMAWAHNQLKKQGFDGRDTFIEFYSDLYHQATTDFYDKYEADEEARQYFFEKTD